MKVQQPDRSGKQVKKRNNISLANVRSRVAQMTEINTCGGKQGRRKKAANGTGKRGGGKGSEAKKGAEERWNKCVRFERE